MDRSIIEHMKRHKMLHKCLDELVADFIGHTKKMPSQTTVMELMQWSAKEANTFPHEEEKK